MHKGTLKKWNDDKGYGFIRRDDGQADVFLHISALRPGIRRPQAGDVIRFQIETADDGKARAIHAVIEGLFGSGDDPGTWRLESGRPPAKVKTRESAPLATHPTGKSTARTRPPRRKSFFWRLVPMLVFMMVFSIYAKLSHQFHFDRLSSASPAPAAQMPTKPSFKCAGKTRCPDMTSCEEAVFYLQNCPGTQMDGDNDGIPCEGQLCGH